MSACGPGDRHIGRDLERDTERDDIERSIAIRGNASPDDVAAVLALLRELAARAPVVPPYERWRAQRLAALRACPPAANRT